MTGDSLTSIANTEQFNGQTCGHKFVCRMRTNDESKRYISMMVSVAVYRDSTNVDKTFFVDAVFRSFYFNLLLQNFESPAQINKEIKFETI